MMTVELIALFILVFLLAVWSGKNFAYARRLRQAFRPEIIHLLPVLESAMYSGEEHSRQKIQYVLTEMRKLK